MADTYSYIVHRASEAIGLKDFNSEGMEGDDFRKVFLSLQDAIRSINCDPGLVFGVATIDKYVAGNALTFKPYTDAELAVIAGGGTIDVTDRITELRPSIAPMAYLDGCRVGMVDAFDLPEYDDSSVCAWNPGIDSDVLMFGSNVNANVKIMARAAIAVPSSPSEFIGVPERFREYLILLLAVNVATKLGLSESLANLKLSLAYELDRVTRNNNYSRPILLSSNMGRFNP